MLVRAVSEERKDTEPHVSSRGETQVLLPTETPGGKFRGLVGGQGWGGADGGVVLKEADFRTRIFPRTDKLPESLAVAQGC